MDAKLWDKAIALYRKENPVPSMSDLRGAYSQPVEYTRMRFARFKENPFRILWFLRLQVKPPQFNSFVVNLIIYTLYCVVIFKLIQFLLGFFRSQHLTNIKFTFFIASMSFLIGLASAAMVTFQKNIRTWEEYLELAKEELKAKN